MITLAQVSPVKEPDMVVSWGPFATQTVHVWQPDSPAPGTPALLYLRGGGFQSVGPYPRIGGLPMSNPLYHLDRYLDDLLALGVTVGSAGATGADYESPEGNVGRGLFRHTTSAMWSDRQAAWYYKDAWLAMMAFRDAVGAPLIVGCLGKSAGAMQACRPKTGAHFVLAFNMPVSWLALEQRSIHTSPGYFRRQFTSDTAATALSEVTALEQYHASIDPLFSDAPLFLASTYAAEFGAINLGSTFDLLSEVHDYGQSAAVYAERQSADVGELDELWATCSNAIGVPGENVFPDPQPGVPFSGAIMAEAMRWTRARFGL